MSRQLPHRARQKLSSRQPALSSRQAVDKQVAWGKPSLPAGRQVDNVVDIFRCPLDNFDGLNERAKTRNRQTQTTLTDPPFQIIEKRDEWSLIQLADQTFGWLPNKQIKTTPKRDYWVKIKRFETNKSLPSSALNNSKIRQRLKGLKGIPYLWGGTTKHGMDCSAFIQKFFFELTGTLLPRNSREQKKCGKTVYSKDICPLDILFFVHSTSGRHHVGVYFDNLVWHFCLDRQGLSSETREEMKKRYRYLTARRLFKFRND